jgi:hypothetical protein
MSSPAETTIPGTANLPSDAEIQAMLARAVKLYAERCAERDQPLPAFTGEAHVTATDAVVAVSAILKAVNVQLFELGMWQTFSGHSRPNG